MSLQNIQYSTNKKLKFKAQLTIWLLNPIKEVHLEIKHKINFILICFFGIFNK